MIPSPDYGVVECICEGIPFDLCSPLGKRNVWRSGAVRARGLEAGITRLHDGEATFFPQVFCLAHDSCARSSALGVCEEAGPIEALYGAGV